MVASLRYANEQCCVEAREKRYTKLFPLSSARSMTDPLHRLKFGALSSLLRSNQSWS